MRIGTHSRYTMLQYNQNKTQNSLNNVLTQMNGLKIQYGYQDSSVFNKTLALDFNVTTLTQSKEIASNALTFTRHTDTALSELSKSMDNFKTKLVQGANDIHSETSRLAIAKDLKAIRDHFLSIANTSIGGEYIFSGSATTTKPFGANGAYNGNNQVLNALLGSNNEVAYNITGAELFFGSDNDTNRIITTNIGKFNQSELNPAIMDKSHPTGQGSEVYIKASDTLRDLVGDNDNDTTNNNPEVFYITGRRPDGIAFKSKFEMDINYTDEKQAATVADLLEKIGKEFGNTETSKVVDVSLNAWGQIEIKDLSGGRSNIEFSMISSSYKDPNNDPNAQNPLQGADGVGVLDIDVLLNSGVKVNSYVQSPFLGTFASPSITSVENDYDHRLHTIPTSFRTHTNEVAKTTTLLSDIFPEGVTQIELSGTRGNDADKNPQNQAIAAQTFNITATSTVQDLMNSISNLYAGNGQNVEVEFDSISGKITIKDNNVSQTNPPDRNPDDLPFDGESSLSLTLTTQDANGAAINGFRHDYSVEFDRVSFSREGGTLTSNVPQIVRDTNEIATMNTKLSEVAGIGLNGHTYNFEVKDVNGIAINGRIEFRDAGSVFIINSPAQINGVDIDGIEIPILQANGNPPQVSGEPTSADNVTYKQLSDTLGMILNLSNSTPANLTAITNNGAGNANFNTPANKLAYEELLKGASYSVSVKLNVDGELEVKDLSKVPTQMELSLYDSTSDLYALNANGQIAGQRPALTFQSNSAVVADDPHVNFFKQIDEMIEALEAGTYRAGGVDNYSDAMRNPGIQNALLLFDHLSDHVEKAHTKNGAQGNAFTYSIERTETLITQVKTLRSETIDTDFAEAYLQFSTLSLNYQAMLSSIGKISQLSLVNYL
ncbi:MAG: flagellar hook-associated protein FlgL [Helicobacteraceae bacterium]|nr:flagellar hook-associated protein FlgL [Helicobacteraceae bacterium]